MSERANIFEYGSEISPDCAPLPLSHDRYCISPLQNTPRSVLLSHVTAGQQIKAGKRCVPCKVWKEWRLHGHVSSLIKSKLATTEEGLELPLVSTWLSTSFGIMDIWIEPSNSNKSENYLNGFAQYEPYCWWRLAHRHISSSANSWRVDGVKFFYSLSSWQCRAGNRQRENISCGVNQCG